jgi:hypothetical protein
MSEIYKFLETFRLTSHREVSKQILSFSDTQLFEFVQKYVEYVSNRPPVPKANLGATDIFADSVSLPMSMELIQQLAIYTNRVYIHDGLASIVHLWNELNAPHYIMKFPSKDERLNFFRSMLIREVYRLFDLKPFIEAGIVLFSPVEVMRPQKDPLGMYIEDFYFEDGSLLDVMDMSKPDIPPDIQAFCDQYLKVYPVRFSDKNNNVEVIDEPLSPRNMILVKFEGDVFYKYYQLFDSKIDPETGQVQNYFDITNTQPVDEGMFNNWVNGCRRDLLEERLRYLETDLLTASLANANFITNLPISKEIITLNLGDEKSVNQSKVINALLNIDLPYFENASIDSIIKARKNELAFEEFRLALDQAFIKVDDVSDSSDFQKEIDMIFRDLLQMPLLRVEEQMNSLKRNLFLSSTLLVGSLVGTIVTGGNTLVTASAILAATQSIKMYKETKQEEDKLKRLPSYFYWQATGSGK